MSRRLPDPEQHHAEAVSCHDVRNQFCMRRWLLDEEEARVFQMPGAIHWGFEDRNLTGSELMTQDNSTKELLDGGPALQRPSQDPSQRLSQSNAAVILEA